MLSQPLSHSREGGNPDGLEQEALLNGWIPAFAEMTATVRASVMNFVKVHN
jgi:hypothetical protein